MELGTAKRCITPQKSLRLSGFSFRNKKFDEVSQDIYLRVYFVKHLKRQLVIVYADLLGWGDPLVSRLRTECSQKFGLRAQDLFFVASHNHSGPPSGLVATHAVEEPDPAYCDFLIQEVLIGIESAEKTMEPVDLFRNDGVCPFNIYRRKPEGPGATMRPNYEVPADQRLATISFRKRDGALKGILISYACHANIAGGNTLHPDFPGIAMDLMDRRFPGCVCLFLQGFTGDMRANFVLGNEFYRGSYQDAAVFGERFGKLCANLAEQRSEEIPPFLYSNQMRSKLPLKNSVGREECLRLINQGSLLEKDWAEVIQKKAFAAYETLDAGLIVLGAGIEFFTLNAEVSRFYAEYARTLVPDALCAGYANGLIGYLCTEMQIRHGGYEPKESAVYFGLNGTYPPEIEQKIQGALETLWRNAQKEIERDGFSKE
ncbi:hypothetical protein Ruko_11420 [Ruthenibacterium sp. TH_2024_36131]|uniref:alkaline ceramidase n=1 Tax=Owariibacterium komagatae TaxID=3136601 RepID=UPI0038B3BEA4